MKGYTCGHMSILNVTEDMECFHEEIFGPVVTVVKAKDFDDALRLANASPFGLSSCLLHK